MSFVSSKDFRINVFSPRVRKIRWKREREGKKKSERNGSWRVASRKKNEKVLSFFSSARCDLDQNVKNSGALFYHSLKRKLIFGTPFPLDSALLFHRSRLVRFDSSSPLLFIVFAAKLKLPVLRWKKILACYCKSSRVVYTQRGKTKTVKASVRSRRPRKGVEKLLKAM